jgi:hypothetical protein
MLYAARIVHAHIVSPQEKDQQVGFRFAEIAS